MTGQRIAVVTGAGRGFARQQLAGSLLEPGEVATVVAWACSPAAGTLTGSVLHADGGFTG